MQRQLTVYAAVLAALCLLATGCSETVSVPSGSDNVIDDGNDTPDETPVEQPLIMTFVTVPTGAEVLINGTPTGVITVDSMELDPSEEYDLSFRMEGYTPIPETRSISFDNDTTLDVPLYVDIRGTWYDVQNNEDIEVTMQDKTPLEYADMVCPNTEVVARFGGYGYFCVETDGSLSKCTGNMELCGFEARSGSLIGANVIVLDFYDSEGYSGSLEFQR